MNPTLTLVSLLFATLSVVIPTHTCLAEFNFVGQLAATRPCNLREASSSDEHCITLLAPLSGALTLRAENRVEEVSVDETGVFQANVPPGRYRVNIRALRFDGTRLNPRLYRLSVRSIRVGTEASPVFLSVRHHTRKAEGLVGIAY